MSPAPKNPPLPIRLRVFVAFMTVCLGLCVLLTVQGNPFGPFAFIGTGLFLVVSLVLDARIEARILAFGSRVALVENMTAGASEPGRRVAVWSVGAGKFVPWVYVAGQGWEPIEEVPVGVEGRA